MLQQECRGLYDGWLQTLFDAHFHWYLTSPGTEDDAYWSELQTAITRATDGAPAAVWDATAPDKRVLLALTQPGPPRRRPGVRAARRQAGRPVALVGHRATGSCSTCRSSATPRLDDDLFLLRARADAGRALRRELALARRRRRADHLRGLRLGLPAEDRPRAARRHRDRAAARSKDPHRARVRLVGTGRAGVPAAPRGRRSATTGPGTFRARVALGEVASGGGRDQVWDVLVRVSAAGFTVTDPVTQLIRSGSAGVIPATTLSDGAGLVAEWRVKEPLRFRRVPLPLRVASVELEGRVLTGTLTGPLAADVTDIDGHGCRWSRAGAAQAVGLADLVPARAA